MGINRINPVFGFDVRPHPGPLPQERGNPFPPLSKPGVWMAEYFAGVNKHCHNSNFLNSKLPGRWSKACHPWAAWVPGGGGRC